MEGCTFVGQSGPDVCDLCKFRRGGAIATAMDPGCAPSVARTSYNLNSPFTAVKGLLGSVFALAFTPGPEQYVSAGALALFF